MKFIIFGIGSAGSRHIANLRRLRPDAEIVRVDPVVGLGTEWIYRDWREAIHDHVAADGAIIASPTEAHAEQMTELFAFGIPFLVEKPPVDVTHTDALRGMVKVIDKFLSRPRAFAVGFCYRFSILARAMENWRTNELDFFARDDLIARYGKTCAETMGSHGIDLACRQFGRAVSVDIESDGVSFRGRVQHERGASHYDMRIDTGPRVSTVNGQVLEPDDGMYERELAAWLSWLDGGERDPRLAQLSDGLRVMEILGQVKNA